MLPWFQQGTMAGAGVPGPGPAASPLDRTPRRRGAGRPALDPRGFPLSCPSCCRCRHRSLADFLFQALGKGKEVELQRTSSLQSPSKTVLHLPSRPAAPPSHHHPQPCRVPFHPRLPSLMGLGPWHGEYQLESS